MVESVKKDIYITITSENMLFLNQFPRFVSNWEYPREERHFYKDDLGKVEGKTCTFRFVKHVNVHKAERFFLEKPDESELKQMSEQELENLFANLIPSQSK